MSDADQVASVGRLAASMGAASLTLASSRTAAMESRSVHLLELWCDEGADVRAVVTWPDTVQSWDRWFGWLLDRPAQDLLVVVETPERSRALCGQLATQPTFDPRWTAVLLAEQAWSVDRLPRGVGVIDRRGHLLRGHGDASGRGHTVHDGPGPTATGPARLLAPAPRQLGAPS